MLRNFVYLKTYKRDDTRLDFKAETHSLDFFRRNQPMLVNIFYNTFLKVSKIDDKRKLNKALKQYLINNPLYSLE